MKGVIFISDNKSIYPIPNFPSYYITKQGKVFGNKKCQANLNQELREIKPYIRKGYLTVKLRNGTERKAVFVHRLVALTFIPNPNNYPVVNHKDRNPLNNCIENLEWCDITYNNLYIAFEGPRLKRTKCIAYMNDIEIKSFDSVQEAADYIAFNYKIPHATGLSEHLESYDLDGNLFKIVREGIDTVEWNAKRGKFYTDFENKNNRGTTGKNCSLFQNDILIKTFNSKNQLYAWVRANLKIPISYIIRYGKYEDYYIKEI